MSSVFNEIFDGGQVIMDNSAPTPVPIPKDSVGQGTKIHPILKIRSHLVKFRIELDEYIAVNELENQFETKLTDEGLAGHNSR